MKKDTQTHTLLTRARDRDAETPYKNCSTDLGKRHTRCETSLYVLIVAHHHVYPTLSRPQ